MTPVKTHSFLISQHSSPYHMAICIVELHVTYPFNCIEFQSLELPFEYDRQGFWSDTQLSRCSWFCRTCRLLK